MGNLDTNALTLAEYALQSNSPMVKQVTYSLLENGNVLQDIPLLTQATLVQQGVVFVGNLPTVHFRNINETPQVTKGQPTPYQEQAYIMSDRFSIDKRLANEENAIQDPMSVQVDAYLRNVTYKFNDVFINNDPVTGDAKAPVGLKYRISNPTKYHVDSDMSINGINGSTITATSAMNEANALDLFEAMDTALSYMGNDSGNGVVFYCNDALLRKLSRAAKQAGPAAGFTTQTDAFDRQVLRYRGATIRDLGRKGGAGSTRIISNTENNDGTDPGNGNYTSMYAVNYGVKTFCGWQWEKLAPRNMGLDPVSGTSFNTVIDWAVGLWCPHTRSIARIYNIKTS